MHKINTLNNYAAPDSLEKTDLSDEIYLLLGTCQLGILAGHAEKVGKRVDHILVSAQIDMPELLPHDPSKYKAQIISLTLRDILEEQSWDMKTGYQRLKCKTEEEFASFYDDCCNRIDTLLHKLMQYNLTHGLVTFVLNFQTPQRNPNGLLVAFYTYKNPIYFFDRLNEYLERATLLYQGAYILNVDRLHSIVGKRFYQDDNISLFSHNSIVDEFNLTYDVDRIVPPVSPQAMYNSELHVIGDILWREIESSTRIVYRIDMVKLVIFDLDDTLWRGVAADDDLSVYDRTEGWPLSMIEVIFYLKARGIMIALCSKNDIDFVKDKIGVVYGGLLSMDDFQSIKCNYRRKDENIIEILTEINILPESTVFIDDNPMEIDLVKRSFPEIRTIGFNHYDWKRILLWSPELQVPYITEKLHTGSFPVSVRNELASSLSDNHFKFEVFSLFKVDLQSKYFKRFFELLNKTNQFNTTGKRWGQSELVSFLAFGGQIDVFFAKASGYDAGLVAASLTKSGTLVQLVLSCRVFGYGIEDAILNDIFKRNSGLSVDFFDTGKNSIAMMFLRRFGLEKQEVNFTVPCSLLESVSCSNVLPFIE